MFTVLRKIHHSLALPPLLSDFSPTYVAVVLAAILPKVADGELLANDDGRAEDHHEADADDPTGGVVEGQRIVEDGVGDASHVVQVVHAGAVKVEPEIEELYDLLETESVLRKPTLSA